MRLEKYSRHLVLWKLGFNWDSGIYGGGAGYTDRQVVVYKVEQVAGYKVSLFRAPKMVIYEISLLTFYKV